MYLIDKELTCYETRFWTRRWGECAGCKPVRVQGVSFDRAPPPMPDPVSKAKTEQIKADVIKVPPFDIQEIPDAMRREGMPVSAKLMERWFAGVLNYAPSDEDLQAEINQNGEPYPARMYDTTSITLDWILKYERAKAAYTDLITQRIYRDAAALVLRSRLIPYVDAGVAFDPWQLCRGSMRVFHKYFHFQFATVGGSLSQKIGEFIESNYYNRGVPDDLTGALGSFNFYAAPAHVKINHIDRVAEISSIYVYVKDSYDFTDGPGAVSQYLGHWSKKGVIVVPYNGLVGQLDIPSLYLPYPVARGDVRVPGNVYYPIHNKDFRAWAIKHQRGGDFMIFSDRKRVRLRDPIRVRLT
jgi:hypothetical protein